MFEDSENINLCFNIFYSSHNRRDSNKSHYAGEFHVYKVIILISFMNIETFIAARLLNCVYIRHIRTNI